MPIEIREMAIRLEVGEAGQLTGNDDDGARPDGGGLGAAERAELVAQCVDAVLEELRRRSER
jgi:hypothetical protein